jgi:hypothetical protein
MEPTGKHHAMLEFWGGLSNSEEDGLSDVLRKVGIDHHAQRHGVHGIDVPPHQYCKRSLRGILHIIVQEFLIVHVVHPQLSSRQEHLPDKKSGSLH